LGTKRPARRLCLPTFFVIFLGSTGIVAWLCSTLCHGRLIPRHFQFVLHSRSSRFVLLAAILHTCSPVQDISNKYVSQDCSSRINAINKYIKFVIVASFNLFGCDRNAVPCPAASLCADYINVTEQEWCFQAYLRVY